MRISTKAVVLASIAALGLTACNAGESSTPTKTEASQNGSEPAKKKEVTAALVDAPTNLDFTTTAGAAIPTLLMNNVYETLITLTPKGEFEGQLAKEWSVSEDGKTITFKLIDDATFSTGEKFDSSVVKFTLERLRDGSWKSSKVKPMQAIESVETPDPTTAIVKLSKPSQQLLFNLTTNVGAMMHPDHVDNLAKEAIGTGPYVVSEFVPEEKAVLKEREDARKDVDVSTATFRYIADATTAVNALRSGDVDILWSTQATQQLDSLKADYNVEEGQTTNKVIIVLNNAAAPFDSLDARKAVAAAIDKQAMIAAASNGRGTALAAPVATTDPWYVSEGGTNFDLDAAKKSASTAGLTNFTIKVPTLPYAQSAAELVNAQLGSAGIVANIENAEFPAVWLDQVYKNRNYEATIIAHVEPRDLPTVMGSEYYWGVKDSSITEKLAAADAIVNADEYKQAMKEVVKEVQDQVIAVPLYELPNAVVSNKAVSGIQADQPLPNLNVTTLQVN